MSPRRRNLVVVTSSALVLLAAFTLLWSVVATSTAQLSASTGGSGSFRAASVELAQPDSAVALLFDADGLFPGRTVVSCIAIGYDGTVPADIRLHASQTGGTGLEEHVELKVAVLASGSCPDGSAVNDLAGSVVPAEEAASLVSSVDEVTSTGADLPGTPIFTGLLDELWRAHPDYSSGLLLVEQAIEGDRLVLNAAVELVGGDEAQGLTTEFAIVIEARP